MIKTCEKMFLAPIKFVDGMLQLIKYFLQYSF